jgi:type II secretion system protein C
MMKKRKIVAFAISTVSAVVIAVVVLIFVNASLLRVPIRTQSVEASMVRQASNTQQVPAPADFSAIQTRNLFRTKLEAELPKPKTEKEIEEERLTGIVKTMILKGVMTGRKKDFYAVIDKGGQKGVWTYEIGEVVEGGLAVTEIRKDSVILQKGEFKVLLRLFTPTFERLSTAQAAASKETPKKQTPQPAPVQKREPGAIDLTKEIRREGKTILLSRALVERIKADNTLLMSSMAVKMETDEKGQPTGYKVVTVDNNSLAQKMGILSGDKLVEVNGYALKTVEDLKRANQNLQNSTRLDIKVLRKGKVETLNYEVR